MNTLQSDEGGLSMYINPKTNESGAYQPPQSTPFMGAISINDEQLSTFLEYNGFVTICVSEDEITVEPNLDAWNAWKESIPPEPEPEPEPEPVVEYATYAELAAAIREGVNLV